MIAFNWPKFRIALYVGSFIFNFFIIIFYAVTLGMLLASITGFQSCDYIHTIINDKNKFIEFMDDNNLLS